MILNVLVGLWNHRGPYKRESDVNMVNSGFEDAERSHKSKNATLKPGKDREMACLLEYLKGALSSVKMISELCKRINLCCSKLSQWQFTIPVVKNEYSPGSNVLGFAELIVSVVTI